MAFLQQVTHTGRIVFVHLATVRFDVEFLVHRVIAAVLPLVSLCRKTVAEYTQLTRSNLVSVVATFLSFYNVDGEGAHLILARNVGGHIISATGRKLVFFDQGGKIATLQNQAPLSRLADRHFARCDRRDENDKPTRIQGDFSKRQSGV